MAKKMRPGARDAAGIGPYAREREALVPMSKLRGWTVPKGEADIRSWEVRTLSGRVLGTVRELLVDTRAGEVVMIDVDLAGSGRHACVPLRVVEIDRTRRVVRADSGDLEESELTDGGHAADTDVASTREVRYAEAGTTERVVERRPVVEETVVRRREARDVDGDEMDASRRI